MIQVYICKLPEERSIASLEKLLPSVSKEKQERIKKFFQTNDAYRSLIGELLVRFILYKQYGSILGELEFSKNLYGKPFLKEYPFFHYNIAHSGEWVVCATGNEEIGVDVEEIIPFNMRVAKGVFTNKEYRDLLNIEDDEHTAFYDIWTLKESYVKAIGRGLSIPLNSFNVKIHDDHYIELTDEFTGKTITDFTCKQYKLNDNYRLSVCVIKNNTNKFGKLPILVSFNKVCSELGILI